jgi:hypothetical protein
MVRGGYMELDGDVSAAGPNRSVSGNASVGSLGVDDPEFILMPEIDLDWGPWHLAFDGFTHKFSGHGDAGARLKIPGQPAIEEGVNVDTDFSVTYVTGEVTYDFVPTDYLAVGPGIGVGWISYDIDIDAENGAGRVSLDDGFPMAYPMLRAAVDLDDFSFLGTLGGISVSFDDEDITYLEADVRAAWKFTGELAGTYGLIVFGYRYIDVDYEFEDHGGDVEVDVDLSGPYVGVAISF